MEDLDSYYDGKFIKKSAIQLDIDNYGFTRGYGVYECFRSYKRVVFHLKDHINRMKKNCEKMLIDLPKINIEEIVSTLIAQNDKDDLIFRVYIIDHPSKKGSLFTILCNTEDFFDSSHPNCSLKVKTTIDDRSFIGYKVTSYAQSMVALKKAKRAGFHEVLFVNEKGLIGELSRANVFAIKGNTLFSPKSGFLAGVTRQYTFEVAKSLGYDIECIDMDKATINQYEEFFSTATIRGIRPIIQIDDIEFKETSKTLAIKKAFMSHAYSDSPCATNLAFSR